jgi:hypothetical protein
MTMPPLAIFRSRLAFLLALVLITGCANVQGAYKQYKDNEEISHINAAKEACDKFGYKIGTDAFAQCVNTNVNAAKDRDSRERAAFHSEKK